MDPLQGNPIRVYFGYAIPAVISMLAMTSAGVIDGIFVGNYVGSSALAAINISMPVVSLLIGVALMMGVGGSVIAGKFLGSQQTQAASLIFTRIVVALTLLSIVASTAGAIKIQTLLRLLGANEELVPIADAYLTILFIFMPSSMLAIVLVYFIRVSGRPGVASKAFILGAIGNIIMDWLFIVYLGWGISGAAWATGLSQLITLLVLIPPLLSKECLLQWQWQGGNWKQVRKAAINGSSEFANEASAGITALIFNWVMITQFGVDGVAAFTVINYLLFAGLMMSFGLADSLHPLVSHCLGDKNPQRIRQFVIISVLAVALVGLCTASIMLVYPDQLIDIFLEESDRQAIEITKAFIVIFWPTFLFNGINLCLSAYCTAMHKPVPSAIIALSRSLVLPGIFVLCLPYWFGTTGIYAAIPLAEALTLLLALYLLYQFRPTKVISMQQPTSSTKKPKLL